MGNPGTGCAEALQPSLVITRNLLKAIGPQTYMPTRFLQGLLPTALLDFYEFWQNADDSLTGYPSKRDPLAAPGTVRPPPSPYRRETTRTAPHAHVHAGNVGIFMQAETLQNHEETRHEGTKQDNCHKISAIYVHRWHHRSE